MLLRRDGFEPRRVPNSSMLDSGAVSVAQ